MCEDGFGINPQTLSAIAAILYTVVTVWLLLGVRRARQQLESAERSRQTELLFLIWKKYEDDAFYEATKFLSDKEFSNLEQFTNAFASELSQAHLARRKIKFTLAPLGYLLKFELIKTEHLFPILPSAIALWGRRLQNVEHDLLEKIQSKKADTFGYKDEVVGFVDYLFDKYQAHLKNSTVTNSSS